MNRPKVSVFIAASLDGYIARRDGGIDWLTANNEPGEDYGFSAFFSTVDGLVMGRKTFEMVLTFGQWHYGETRVIVLSRTWEKLPEGLPPTISLSALPPKKLLTQLGAEGMRHLYLDGGLAVQSFLAAGVVDELTLTQVPIVLGEGIPLFGTLPKEKRLVHRETRVFSNGYVQSRYRV